MEFQGRRWFRNKEAAVDFAVYHALFTRFDLFCNCAEAVALVQVQEDDCTPLGGYETVEREGEFTLVRHDGQKCHYAGVEGTKRGGCVTSLKVMVKGNDGGTHFPRLVAVRYSNGGVGYYLTDDCGRVTSGIHLRLPDSRTTRSLDGDPSCCCVAIIGHRMAGRRMDVHIAWNDGRCSWQPLSSLETTAFWVIFHYADSHQLFSESPWKKFESWGGLKLPNMFVRGHHSEHLTEESLRLERKFQEQKQLLLERECRHDL